MGQGYRDRGIQQDRQGFQPPSDDEIKQIIVHGDPETLVTLADRVGKWLAKTDRLTTNQIRNVFGTVRQIQMRWPANTDEIAVNQAYREAVLLRPKMAYFAEREKRTKDRSEGMETLQKTLEPALKLLNENGKPSRERFNRFVDLFEAIVAYHKKYGGR